MPEAGAGGQGHGLLLREPSYSTPKRSPAPASGVEADPRRPQTRSLREGLRHGGHVAWGKAGAPHVAFLRSSGVLCQSVRFDADVLDDEGDRAPTADGGVPAPHLHVPGLSFAGVPEATIGSKLIPVAVGGTGFTHEQEDHWVAARSADAALTLSAVWLHDVLNPTVDLTDSERSHDRDTLSPSIDCGPSATGPWAENEQRTGALPRPGCSCVAVTLGGSGNSTAPLGSPWSRRADSNR